MNPKHASFNVAIFGITIHILQKDVGLFFKIKNEGTNKITGARDRATGVIPGVADTCLIHEGKAYFFEFKTTTGVQSPVQKSWERTIKTAGAEYYLVRSLELFQILITDIYA
jgi:hypothetical protein